MTSKKNRGFVRIAMLNIIENMKTSRSRPIAWFAKRNGVLLNEYGSD